MLTLREHRMLEWISVLASIFFVLPIVWTRKSNTFVFLSSNSKQEQGRWSRWLFLGFLVCVTISSGHTLYLCIRFIPGFGYSPDYFHPLHYSVIIHALYLLSVGAVTFIQIGSVFYAEELSVLLNQLLRFNISNGQKYLHKPFAKPDIKEKVIYCLAGYLVVLVLFLFAIGLIFPKNPYVMYSTLSAHAQFGNCDARTAIHVVVGIIEAYDWFKVIVVNWFIFFVGFVYIKTSKFWMHLISFEVTDYSNCQLRTDCFLMYRALTLLNTMYNNGFSSLLFPSLKSGMEIATIFCLFGVFRFYHNTALWIYAFFVSAGIFSFIQIVSAIAYMATLCEMTTEWKLILNKRNLRDQGRDSNYRAQERQEVKLAQKIGRSCRPLFCRIGSIFFVEKSTKLAYISLLLHTFMSILIATV